MKFRRDNDTAILPIKYIDTAYKVMVVHPTEVPEKILFRSHLKREDKVTLSDVRDILDAEVIVGEDQLGKEVLTADLPPENRSRN